MSESKQVRYMRKWRRERWTQIEKYKESNPCTDCDRLYPYYVMDFDHARGEKFRGVSRMQGYSWERVLAEIAKCDLVCANCHRIRTQSRI
jgi:hypothetical protein